MSSFQIMIRDLFTGMILSGFVLAIVPFFLTRKRSWTLGHLMLSISRLITLKLKEVVLWLNTWVKK